MPPGVFIARYRTHIIFAVCAAFALLSIALLFVTDVAGLIAIVVAMAANVGAIIISERSGFARTVQLRRAFEPARHFNSAQVGVLIVLSMVQLTALLYVLISR